MAKQIVYFTRSHTVVRPATVLETVSMSGERSHIADIAETRTEYHAGQQLEFRSKKDAAAFVKAMEGAATLANMDLRKSQDELIARRSEELNPHHPRFRG